MSLSRIGEDGEWFDVNPGYVYVSGEKWGMYEFNTSIGTVPHFCEFAMRALDQSGELDEETLEQCEQALRTRFDGMIENK
jgi:hypothetical protein